MANQAIPSTAAVLAKGRFPELFLERFFRSRDEIPAKTRSDALMEIGYLAAESGLADAEIYSLVRDADTRWEKFVNRRDRDRWLVDIVERARRKHPYGLDDLQFNGLFGSPVDSAPQIVYNWSEFANSKVFIQWMLEGMIAVMGHILLVGDPGVGKTQIGIRLTTNLACGRSFLGWKNLVGPQRILFLSLEMGHPSLKYFTDIMNEEMDLETRNLLESNYLIVPIGEDIPLDKQEGRQFIEALIKEYKPAVVFFDSLGKMSTGSLSDETPAKALDRYLSSIRRQFSISTIAIHHTAKGRDSGGLDDMFGSRYLGTNADTVMRLTEDNELIKVSCMKTRLSMKFKPFLLKRSNDLDFSIAEPEDRTIEERGLKGAVINGFRKDGSFNFAMPAMLSESD